MKEKLRSAVRRLKMGTLRGLIQGLIAACAFLLTSAEAFAADPGLSYPVDSQTSDQKAGSVLIYSEGHAQEARPMTSGLCRRLSSLQQISIKGDLAGNWSSPG
jgi:hypothetical protein